MSDIGYDDELDDSECWNCGGEGRINDCIDGCCVDQDDIYCPYCSKRCDVCNSRKGKPNVTREDRAEGSAVEGDAGEQGGETKKTFGL